MASINTQRLRLMSYNVTSVVRREKRKIVDDLIKREKVDIALLQETHL